MVRPIKRVRRSATAPRVPAAELVVDRIRHAIHHGELKAGDRLLPERELARQFAVSRATIRSGLTTLAGMGVLQIRQGSGTFITSGPPALDSGPLSFLAALHGFTRRQMFEARMSLEVSVAGLAAERANAETLIAISDETTAMFASLRDPDAFLRHDIAFHRAVAVAADNPVLSSMVEMVSSIFEQLRRLTIRNARDLRQAADEHRQIYQAIRHHNPAKARQFMADHLRRAERSQVAEGLANKNGDRRAFARGRAGAAPDRDNSPPLKLEE